MALNVTIVGVGLVGEQLVQCLKDRDFPCHWPPRVAATRERPETLAGEKLIVEETTAEVFEGADVVLFAGAEGAKGASVQWRETAVAAGAWCVDNGRDFRYDPDVPLVVPEVNADAITAETPFIASPNCSTIQMVMAVAPIHREANVRRIIASTYQATSGTGLKGPAELRKQTPQALESIEGIDYDPSVFARPIAFNCLPQIDRFLDNLYTREEWKMEAETHKILGDPTIRISTTAVRVPVFNGHAEAVWLETEKKLSPDEAREVLAAAPGLVVIDEPTGDGTRSYPTQHDILQYKNETLVGRIREDTSSENGLAMWIVADNLRKGAALNVVQVAEKVVERGYVKG